MHTIAENTQSNDQGTEEGLPRPLPFTIVTDRRKSDNLAFAFLMAKGALCSVQRAVSEHPDRTRYISLTYFLWTMDAVRTHTLYRYWQVAEFGKEEGPDLLAAAGREWKVLRNRQPNTFECEDPIEETLMSEMFVPMPEGQGIEDPYLQDGEPDPIENPEGIWIPIGRAKTALELFRYQLLASLPEPYRGEKPFTREPDFRLKALLDHKGCSFLDFDKKELDILRDPLCSSLEYTNSEALEEMGISSDELS
jgi:hypothetical protein